MGTSRNDNLQGSLVLLILKSLDRGPMHVGITLHIQRVSKDVLRVEEGSLYPGAASAGTGAGLQPSGA